MRNLMRAAKENPNAVLEKLGIDVDQLSQRQMQKALEKALAQEAEALMSPEEKELRDLRNYKKDQEQKALEAQKAKELQEQKAQEARIQAQANEHAQKWGQMLLDGVNKLGLPQGSAEANTVAAEMVQILKLAHAAGALEGLTTDDLVSEWVQTSRNKYSAAMKAGSAKDFLTPEATEVLRKIFVAEHQAKQKAKEHPAMGKGSVSKGKKQEEAPKRKTTDNLYMEMVKGWGK